MALSLPQKVVVEAVNKTTVALKPGYVCQILMTRDASGVLCEAYRFDRSVDAGSTVLDQIIPTIGVLEGAADLAAGDTGSFCVAGATSAYCDANGSAIDTNNALFVSDDDVHATAVAFTLTNDVALSSNNAGAANTAISGALAAAELETVVTALRGRASDPLGGPLKNGAALLAVTKQGNVNVVIYNNPLVVG